MPTVPAALVDAAVCWLTLDTSSTIATTQRSEHPKATIDVADNGPRTPEMERDILLDDDHRTPLYHGSGLGLWLVKLMVTQSWGVRPSSRTHTGAT